MPLAFLISSLNAEKIDQEVGLKFLVKPRDPAATLRGKRYKLITKIFKKPTLTSQNSHFYSFWTKTNVSSQNNFLFYSHSSTAMQISRQNIKNKSNNINATATAKQSEVTTVEQGETKMKFLWWNFKMKFQDEISRWNY